MPNDQSWNVATARVAANISLSAAYIDLAAPRITATAASSSSISIALTTPSPNAVSYTIERSPDGTNWSVLIANRIASDFPYTDAGLDAETTYHYRAFAKDATTDSNYSGTTSDTTSAATNQAYTPLTTYDFENEAVGPASSADWNISEYSDVVAKTGTKSLKCKINATQPGSCPSAGSNSRFFGGDRDLPAVVTEGYVVWLRVWQWIPTTFSFGSLWQKDNATHDAEASGCGLQNNEGASSIKWLRFTPDVSTGRAYFNIEKAIRQIAQPAGATIRLGTEVSPLSWTGSAPYQLPLGQWVCLQLGVKVAKNNTGWLRAWVGSTLMAESLNVATIGSSDSGLAQFSIGNYWNAYPYTDGAARDLHFFNDEIVVATDMPGYGAPTGVDDQGNAIIDPAHTVGGFA